jgi:hypothetical protein
VARANDAEHVIALRPELQAIVDALVQRSAASSEVTLDAIGEAIGALTVGQDEIERMLDAIEARGFRVVAPSGGGGPARLKKVLDTARAFVTQHGRRPSVDEIASASGLTRDEVSTALALARVMQR